MGHVRDLPASASEIPARYKGESWARLGVRLDDFEPLYVVPTKKKKVVSQLKNALKGVSELYIATDEDREGESIGWHLVELLAPKVPVRRMVFHEITEEAILAALEHTRDLDQHLVDAQETRRVLDRLVGYTLSPLLWKKIAPRLSAGRVQSVAVRLLVLREEERIAFMPASYWDLQAGLEKDKRDFAAVMTHLDGIRLASGRDFDADTGKLKANLKAGKDVLLLAKKEAKELAKRLKDETWRASGIEEKEASRSPSAPFTTSTLQQEASRKLSLSASRTMRIAQGLYENGYITYMRTDSTNLSQEALSASRRTVKARYGSDYLSPKPKQYATKAKGAQEAHEAIRPAGTAMKTAAEHGLGNIEAALYDLIWKRTVASQMANARLKFVTARLEVKTGKQTAEFRASGRTILFPGFFRAYVEGSDDPDAALDDREQPLPELKEGDAVDCRDLIAQGHETKPPARYTEASLVKLLEKEGIGRPSTYATIMETIVRRGYVRKNGGQLVPTFTAFATNQLLEARFQQLVDTGFTAAMEQVLDDIATGDKASGPYLRNFYAGTDGLEARVEDALETLDARGVATLSFPKWGPYVVRVGKFGPYVEGEAKGEKLTASVPDELAPGDVTAEVLGNLLKEGNAADEALGKHPETGQEVFLKRGPYGPYVQLGENEQAGKPKRISLPKGLSPHEVDFKTALDLLSLPRTLGEDEHGEKVQASIGRYGPYVKKGSTFASLPAGEDVLTVELERALELISKKEARNKPLRVLGEYPADGKPVEVRDGRYGPYVKHGKTNASLHSGQEVNTLTLEEGLELLAAKAGNKKGTSKGTSKRASKAKGTAKKSIKKTAKKPAKKSAKKSTKEAAPKATPDDLEPFLPRLDSQAAEVVTRLEGMRGKHVQDEAGVAQALSLSPEEVKKAHKRGMFKLRMAYGKARQKAA